MQHRISVAVAMATFNGERYLLEQLESIARQSHQPDELVISDDGSNDRTIEMARAWAATAPMRVRISVAEKRLGITANFEQALRLTTADIIFLSDQDDVWLPQKIERVLEEFMRDPEILLVLNDQWITDENLRSTSRTSHEILKRKYHLYDRQSLVSGHGCCMAVRRPLLDLALPLPSGKLDNGHDVWLAKLTAMMGRQKIVSEPLQLYRRHSRAATIQASFTGVTIPTLHHQDHPSATSISPHKPREWLPKIVLNSIINSIIILYRTFIFFLRSNQEEMCLRRQQQLKFLDVIEERFALVPASTQFGDLSLAHHRLQREKEVVANRLKLYKRSWLRRRVGALHLLLKGDYKYAAGWKSFVIDFIRF
jgi:glycosyltransferase involved in cell wall biosynthesis